MHDKHNAGERLVELAKRYEELAEKGASYVSSLEEAKAYAEVSRFLWRDTSDKASIAHLLLEARRSIASGSFSEAAAILGKTCRTLLSQWLRRYGAFWVDVDTCPAAEDIELVARIMEAAGPTAIVVNALAGSRRVSEYVDGIKRIALIWPKVVESLSKLYTAGYLLEKNGYTTAFSLLEAEAEKLRTIDELEDKLSILERDANEAYSVARSLEKLGSNLKAIYSISAKPPSKSILAARLRKIGEEIAGLQKSVLGALEAASSGGAPAVVKLVSTLVRRVEEASRRIIVLASKIAVLAGVEEPKSLEQATIILRRYSKEIDERILAIVAAAVLDNAKSFANLVDKVVEEAKDIKTGEALSILYELSKKGIIDCTPKV